MQPVSIFTLLYSICLPVHDRCSHTSVCLTSCTGKYVIVVYDMWYATTVYSLGNLILMLNFLNIIIDD